MEYLFNFDKLAYLKGRKPEGCILCLVASGSAEVDRLVVRESPSFMVSLNLYPYNPGHLIVFPRRHETDYRGLSTEEKAELDELVGSCLDALDRTMRPTGYNIGYNMGPVAGASIDHLHLHIIPRYPNELGIADLIGGSRVLVQDPKRTMELLKAAFEAEDHE
jgi:Diadenosine tetraphosphate (Ap4A) hydrolase and other HIT family hydrolases